MLILNIWRCVALKTGNVPYIDYMTNIVLLKGNKFCLVSMEKLDRCGHSAHLKSSTVTVINSIQWFLAQTGAFHRKCALYWLYTNLLTLIHIVVLICISFFWRIKQQWMLHVGQQKYCYPKRLLLCFEALFCALIYCSIWLCFNENIKWRQIIPGFLFNIWITNK